MYSISGIGLNGEPLSQKNGLKVFSKVLLSEKATIHTNFDTMDGGRTFSKSQRQKDRNQAQRFLATRQGRVVLHSTQREEARALSTYYQERGLAHRRVHERPIFVEAPLHDTEAVFDEVGKMYEDLVIEPYFASPSLVELARVKNVQLKHATSSSLELVERLNDKGYFAKALDKWFRTAHEERFFPYPIAHYEPLDTTDNLLHEVEACCHYSLRYPRPLKYLLIVQETSLSGGLGNYFVDHQFVLHLGEGKTISLGNVHGLMQWLRQHNRSFRIAPFVDIVESYSFSISITDDGCAWDGPRYQLVDDQGAWIGCRLKREDSWSFEKETEVCRLVGTELQRSGYIGTVAIDLFRFRAPDGRELISAFELNGRLNGNAGALGMLLRYPIWRERVTSGDLAATYLASCPLPPSCSTIEGARGWFKRLGIEASSSAAPDGVTFVTHPVSDLKGGAFCGLLIIETTDERRDTTVRRILEG